jgi:hypothetical protein
VGSPILEYRIRSKDESKAGVDSAKQSAKGFVGAIDDMRKSTEGLRKTVGLLVGEGALFGLGRILRQVAQFSGECEQAFAKLYPESQKSAGSMTSFNKAMEQTKAAIGGAIGSVLTPFREWFSGIQDPIKKTTEALASLNVEFASMVSRFGTADEKANFKLITDRADAMKMLAEQTRDYNAAMREGGKMWTSFSDLEQKVSDAGISTKQSDKELMSVLLERVMIGMRPGSSKEKTEYKDVTEIVRQYTEARFAYNNNTEYIGKLKEAMDFLSGALNRINSPGSVFSAYPNTPGNEEYGGRNLFSNSWIAGSPPSDYSWLNNPLSANPEADALSNSGVDLASRFDPFKKFLTGVTSQFGSLVASLGTVNALYNRGSTILQAMFAFLQPTIDALLTPLVGILSIIGQTLGAFLLPLFQALSPIVAAVVDVFVGAYNFLLPVFNHLIFGFVGIVNALNPLIFVVRVICATFSWLGSVISDFAYNLMNWGANRNTAGDLGTILAGIVATSGPIDPTKYFLNPITPGDVTSAGTQYMAGAGGTASAGATPTYHAQNISVVVYVTAAFGDNMHDLSLMIRDEIRSAEALGY